MADKEIRERIERLVGTAILKNDKNYINDIMQAVHDYCEGRENKAYRSGYQAGWETGRNGSGNGQGVKITPEIKAKQEAWAKRYKADLKRNGGGK